MKDGRTLDANVVDDALDVLLDNSVRLRTPVGASTADTAGTADTIDTRTQTSDAVNTFGTGSTPEAADRDARENREMQQARASPVELSSMSSDVHDVDDADDSAEVVDDEDEASFQDAYRKMYRSSQGIPDSEESDAEDVYGGYGYDGDGQYGEDYEDHEGEEYSDDDYAEYMDPRDEDSGAQPAPNQAARSQDDTEALVPGKVSDVPDELREQVICRKFNIVDRVWKAPTSVTLPKVPALSEDAMLPENAWMRLPHIAVNGMTNCGKSTLINHILRWTYAAKASSVPGRTKSIDFYCINNRFVLVDLPGYPDPEELAHQGVLKKWEAHWQDLVLTYLQMCADGEYDLRLMLQLQATQRRPSLSCRRFVNEMKEKELPLLLVLTKDDQLKKPNEERNYFATQIKKTLGLEGQHLHFTAKGTLAMSRRSKKHLHRWIRTAVTAKDAGEVKQIMQEAWQSRRICETLKTPEELKEKKERWKAHYKTLRDEKKRKAEEEKRRAEAEERQMEKEKESSGGKVGKATKLRIRIPPAASRRQEIDA